MDPGSRPGLRLVLGRISFRSVLVFASHNRGCLLDILQPAWHGQRKIFVRRAAMRALLFVAPTQHVPRML